MFKAAVPSVAPSASASASSHDTHSLPPAFKGPVQRFLAVSLPTITLTPEFIDILDSVDVIIPSRIQVTIRWWNEDTASSLAVFPRLNSPLPPSVEAHQALLRQQRLGKEKAHQLQQPELQRHQQQQLQQERSLSSIASNSAQPSLTTPLQPRSVAAKFLRQPWTAGGARLMNVFRMGNSKKSKENKTSSSKAPLLTQNIVRKGSQQPQDDHAVADALHPKNKRRQGVQSVSDLTPILTPTLNTPPHPHPARAAAPADAKPLPTLPDAAYPVTLAYPVRCSLDQLYRYFLEMTSLALEIQVTPNLTILASVPNLADLFRNIHGTFSGVFPFTTVLQNDDPNLAHHKIFNRKTVLGMAVFQAWCQDTSDVDDTSEGSDSASNASIHNDENRTAHHHHYRPHNGQGSIRHHRQTSYQHFGHHANHSSASYRHPPPPQPHPPQQQQQPHQLHPSLGILTKLPPSVHPLSPSAVIDPTEYHQQQQKAPQYKRSANIIGRHPPEGPRHPDSHVHHQLSLRFEDEPAIYRHRRFPSHPHSTAIGSSGVPYENQHHRGGRGGGGRHQTMTVAAGVGSIDSSSRQYPNIKLPIPDLGPPYDASYRRPVRNGVQRLPQDDSLYRHRRAEDTNMTTQHGQGSRSRPRSGATAAAIGRLDSVLARGEDLLQGMKTSLALDPEEVRTRSARHLRSSMLKDDHQDASRFRPYHESLPYWPSKSRFKLELSITTAYLTSHGLLKGSKHKKYHSLPLPEQQQPHSKQQRQAYHRPQQQQQQLQPRLTTQTASSTAAGSVIMSENMTRSPQHTRQSSRDSRKEFWTSMMGGDEHRRQDSLGGGSESTPKELRRSRKPIQFEKVARKSELARLQLAQEESAATAHGHYQSFQTSLGSSRRLYQQEDQQQDRHDRERRRSSSSRRRRKDGPSSPSLSAHQQPRKSKSYPPATFATMGVDSGRPWKQQNRRRLSSNDRLQIRMNPRPGDLLNDTPDLFPSRSMSGLVRPEYHSSVTESSFSGAEDSYSTGQSYSMSTEDEDLRYGGAMGGRQSRLQRRRKVSSVGEEDDVDEEVKRVDQQRRRRERSQNRRKEARRRRRKNKDQGRGHGHEQQPGKRLQGVHAQHFNFKAQSQLMLTPEVMAACMLENISVEVWKLNPKRQTMIELGSAKLPLHKVLSRILQKSASTSASGVGSHGSSRDNMWGGEGAPQDSYYGSRSAARMREWQQQQRGGRGRGGARETGAFKEGWRLEPSLYDIRSRQGTIIGQLDADVWILPRSRSDSMVSAAA